MRVRVTPASWLQAVGIYSALVGCWFGATQITTLSFSWSSPAVVGWSVSVCALLAMSVFLCYRAGQRYVLMVAQRTPLEESKFKFREDRWREGELESIAEMGRRGIGANFPPLGWVVERLARNPEIVRVARSVSTDEVVGFTMLYPLTANAARRIDNGKLRSGTELSATDMCKKFDRAHSLYIGVVAGEGAKVQGFVLRMLRRRLRTSHFQGRPAAVYGKPATKDGARLLKKFGFRPIPGNENICRTDHSALIALL